MRTISEIQDYCLHLDQNNMAGHPLLLSDEEITMLYNAFCSKEDAERKDDYIGGCRGMFMGHPVFSHDDWDAFEAKTCYIRYGNRITTVAEVARQTSEPVRIGDTIKALLKDWKIDPIES